MAKSDKRKSIESQLQKTKATAKEVEELVKEYTRLEKTMKAVTDKSKEFDKLQARRVEVALKLQNIAGKEEDIQTYLNKLKEKELEQERNLTKELINQVKNEQKLNILEKIGLTSIASRYSTLIEIEKTENKELRTAQLQNFKLGIMIDIWKSIGKFALDAMLNVNKQVVELQRNLGISHQASIAVQKSFKEIEASTDNVFYSTKNLIDAHAQLNQQFKTSARLNDQLVKDQVSLTKEYQLQEQEAANILKLASLQNVTADEFVASSMKGTAELYKQSGIVLNYRDVLDEVSKTTGRMRTVFMRNREELGRQVAQAKQLGINLKEAEGIADGLLDIENSIASQFEAEVLSGKRMNFERARYLAFTNDIAGASREILKQVGSAEEFGKKNRIEQEAIAKAVGMTTDGLADALFQQELLRDAANQDQKNLIKNLSKEEMARVRLGRARGEDMAQSLKQVDAMQKFQALHEKIISMIGNAAENLLPTMEAVFNVFSSIVGFLGKIESSINGITAFFAAVAGYYTGMVLKQTIMLGLRIKEWMVAKNILKTNIADTAVSTARAVANTVSATAMSFGAMLPVIIGAAGAVAAMLGAFSSKSADDAVIDKQGGLKVSGPKGSIQLDKDDEIIAGTDLTKSASKKPAEPYVDERKLDAQIAMGAAMPFGMGLPLVADALAKKDEQRKAGIPSAGGMNTKNIEDKLDRLISIVEKGKEINMSGRKVGETIAMESQWAYRG